jgi:hypothetical protein
VTLSRTSGIPTRRCLARCCARKIASEAIALPNIRLPSSAVRESESAPAWGWCHRRAPDEGVVTLGGHVVTDADKADAKQVARSFAAHQVVANQVAVLPPTDSGLARWKNALIENTSRTLGKGLNEFGYINLRRHSNCDGTCVTPREWQAFYRRDFKCFQTDTRRKANFCEQYHFVGKHWLYCCFCATRSVAGAAAEGDVNRGGLSRACAGDSNEWQVLRGD